MEHSVQEKNNEVERELSFSAENFSNSPMQVIVMTDFLLKTRVLAYINRGRRLK